MSGDLQPWLGNSEWVQKRVSGTTASNVKQTSSLWLAGAFALVLGAVGLVLNGAETLSKRSPSFALLLIFPAMGITLLCWKVLLKARARRYAGTYFEMNSLPFFLGENLCGKIHAPSSSGLRGPVQVSVNCIRRRRSATHWLVGRTKTTFDDLIWRQERLAPFPASAGNEAWITIPIEFSLPPDAPTTNSANPDDTILWFLRASAKVWGVDLLQYFEVPVFTPTGVSARPAYGDRDFYAPVAVSLPTHPPAGDRQVIIRPLDGGGTEFLFLAKRHWRIAMFATTAFFVWTAVIRYFLWGSDSLSFSFFVIGDLLLFYWALWGWFSRSAVIFQGGTVTVRDSLLGIGKSKKVPYGDIHQVTSPVASQSGQGTEAIPAYAIYLQTSTQGTVTLGTGLRNAGEAGYIVERIKAELNI